ncbi:MAG TPA: c-type cytochrome, partial [Comamonas sp.]
GAGVGMHELAQAQRIQKIGSIEIREADGDRPLRSGEDVYKVQCVACHGTGVSGAPKFSDAAEWGPRLSQSFDALVQSSLKGKGAMAPQGGGEFNDLEIARAVAFMANAAGGSFEEPQPEAKEEVPAN